MLSGETPPLEVLQRVAGRDFTERAREPLLSALLEDAVRERAQLEGNARRDAPRVRWAKDLRTGQELELRRLVALLLIVLQWVGTDTGRAATSQLFLGRGSRMVDGKWVYLRKAQQARQGGLAARLGTTVKTLQRYIGVYEAAGLLHCWQPQRGGSPGEKGARAPVGMPRPLRGKVYAYQHYQVIGPVPRCLRLHLERFYGVHRGKRTRGLEPEATAAARAAAASSSAPMSPAGDASGFGLADACTELLEALKRGGDPPS